MTIKMREKSGKEQVVAYPEEWPNVLILEEAHGETVLYLEAREMTMNEAGEIEELLPDSGCAGSKNVILTADNDFEDDVKDLFGMGSDDVDKVLEEHYEVARVAASVPKHSFNGAPELEFIEDYVYRCFGYDCADSIKHDPMGLFVRKFEYGPEEIYLKLVKKPKAD